MEYEEIEFLNAYDELTKIISENDFQMLEHKFFRSYHVDYEYTYKNTCIFMKCDDSQLLVEMVFYDVAKNIIQNTFAFHFTQCGAYFEWLEHFTNLRFKEAIFAKDNYGLVKVRNQLLSDIELFMKNRNEQTADTAYKWI